MMQPNYLAFAAVNARREFGAPRKIPGHSHWSYYDTPQWAICGQYIEPEQFNRTPTCPECLKKLQEMADADIR